MDPVSMLVRTIRISEKAAIITTSIAKELGQLRTDRLATRQ